MNMTRCAFIRTTGCSARGAPRAPPARPATASTQYYYNSNYRDQRLDKYTRPCRYNTVCNKLNEMFYESSKKKLKENVNNK